ncbi:MAG: hypothetical protein ABL961_14270 [Vicinamibacterales bacterium]
MSDDFARRLRLASEAIVLINRQPAGSHDIRTRRGHRDGGDHDQFRVLVDGDEQWKLPDHF